MSAISSVARCSCDPAPSIRLSEADSRQLLRIASRLLGCEHLAEDALQEALLSLSQQEVQPLRPAAWLARAIVHRCRHLRRTVRRRRHHEHVASESCPLHVECDNPLHLAMAAELSERIEQARASLPRDQRRTLDLLEIEGKSYAQIADTLGIPTGTVRSRLARARQALGDAIQPREEAAIAS